jgi:hypothetical protein
VTVDFVAVALLPGLKGDVAEESEVRHVLRVESVFKLLKNVAQAVETEEGMRGFGVELPGAADDAEDWAKTTDANAEIKVSVPNILKTEYIEGVDWLQWSTTENK